MRKRKLVLISVTLLAILLPVFVQANTEVTHLGASPMKEKQANGEFFISIFNNDRWHEIGSLSFGKVYSQKEIKIGRFLSNEEPVKIRLEHKGGGAAHIDSVFLGSEPPTEVNGKKGLELKKLSKKDLDVIDAFEKSVNLNFPFRGKDNSLRMTARVEPTVIGTTPLQFPIANVGRPISSDSQFYTYRLGSERSHRIDRKIHEISTKKPFFNQYMRTSSGHPSGFTYGWVANDEDNLYVLIDFTPDNTMDGDKDYSAVYVNTEKGVKEFKVSVPETRWGKSAFTYTDTVPYQHKIYEFTIPFTELGIDRPAEDRELLLAFSAYGTTEVELDYGDAPDPPYPTVGSNDGARHMSGDRVLFLGSSWDSEPDGQPDANATGDDINNDDEDGVVFTTVLIPGSIAGVNVISSDVGVLSAWIDFNGDGDWSDPGEQIFTNEIMAAGVNSLTFPVPVGAAGGQTFSRFRLSSETGLDFVGSAYDGEVEDYQVEIVELGSITIVKDAVPDSAQLFGFTSALGSFTLYDDGVGPNSTTFTDLLPGSYNITENVTTTIVKDAVPDSAQLFGFTSALGSFTLYDDGVGPNSTTFTDLLPGSYNITENVTTGWNLTDITCTDPDGQTVVSIATATASIDLDSGESITCTFTNTQAAVSTARYTLRADVVPTGSGTVTGNGIACPADCSESYDEGTTVRLNAIPAAGYVFDHWGGCPAPRSQCDVIMSSDRAVTAHFRQGHILRVELIPRDGGRVGGTSGINCPMDCREDYSIPTTVTLTSQPNGGFMFTGWNGCDPGEDICSTQCTVLVEGEVTVQALFSTLTGRSRIMRDTEEIFSTTWLLYIPVLEARLEGGQTEKYWMLCEYVWPGGYFTVIDYGPIPCPIQTEETSILLWDGQIWRLAIPACDVEYDPDRTYWITLEVVFTDTEVRLNVLEYGLVE